MKKWYEILEEVKNSKGKEKQKVLEENKNNELLKEVLNFLYNPRIVTGISKKKMNKEFEPCTTNILDSDESRVKEIMNHLKSNNTGRDYDIDYVKTIIHSSDNEVEEKYLGALSIKDTPFGISANTINKVFEGLIPQHKVQKSVMWDGEDLPARSAVMTKLDGNNCTLINGSKQAQLISRSGAVMEGFKHIEGYAQEKLPKGFVYFGELVLKNYDHLPHDEQFRLGNGIVNSKSGDKTKLTLVVFDVVSEKDFKAGKSSMKFEDRLDIIRKNIHKQYSWNDSYFNEIERIPVHTYTSDKVLIANTFNDVTNDQKQEGLMLVELDSPWQAKKVKYSRKVKPNMTVDVYVTGMKEHIRGNKVGALAVDYKGNTVYVSGIVDELRDQWWSDSDSIVGRLIEVEAMGESENKEGIKSLRHPRFVRIRTDKDEVSYD